MSPDGRQRRSLGQLRTRVGELRAGTAARAGRALDHIGRDRRSWIRHGIAAAAIAGLGLAGAGAVAMTGVAHEANPAVTGISSTAGAPDDAGSTGHRADTSGRSRAGLREATRSGQRSDTQGSGSSEEQSTGQPLDGTVDMAARRAAQKNSKVVDTGQEDTRAEEAARQRSEALKSDAEKSRKLSGTLSKEQRQQQMRAAQEADAGKGNASSGSTAVGRTDSASSDNGSDSGTADLGSSDTAGGTSSGGGALPIAKGSYNIVATFGQVGSWSRYHTGVDFAAPIGTPIRATADGVVTNGGTGPASGWAGIYVSIKFPDGKQMLMAHMASAAVRTGQRVAAGQVIGRVGMTGRTFGPHTHLELYPAGVTPGDVYRTVNPLPWFTAKGLKP
ncbi:MULTISPECIES: M23 family metallopeptidase [Actinomycetes]|jgi:murein DD-endopeptidase MepM/ murein hydrolase activator NlpD|uniref:M23 family metallopeptidase n=2 Tax=Actinomycetes TaxID=1760 RepID=A0A967B4G3_9MICO|nr:MULTISPECIES: M23 family metallopeptidase [Actinomycetes]NOP36715.1 M23 family metallopeptidase [Calidifontibacter sp. DB2511S]NHN54446.1 M23 family metallopeptidase [Metallococcus carri]NYI72285.1 murein DD-endopeptidase MepM/ murein hydrolase activator NlpD [Naumannella cuiyingiana]OYO05759.1 hypothetical protein CGZ97_03405 [Enemella evansiae]UZF58454.1 M23 family metallopeptidase [Gordonia polyisoprenivorans]